MKPSLTPEFLAEKTWDLYQSHGVPIEVSIDILNEKGLEINKHHLNLLIESHQQKSQAASAGQFTSGVGEDTTKARRLHTATHIVHTVLRKLFGTEVRQMGSAITNEKARFDFSIDTSLSQDDLSLVESHVQKVIDSEYQVKKSQMSESQARELGAIGLFGEKYGETVTVYSLENKDNDVFSREFCGGPHVNNTIEIGRFRIIKHKSIGQGVKRIEFDVL